MLYFGKLRAVVGWNWLEEYVNERIIPNAMQKRIMELSESPRPLSVRRFRGWYYERNELGFDSCTNTYKLVRLSAEQDGANNTLATHVYDFRAEEWRPREPCRHDLIPDRCVFASGARNWCYRAATGIILGISSSDLRTETLNLIPTPSTFATDMDLMFEMGGALTLINGCTSVMHEDIWLLRDYETKQWVKRCRTTALVFIHFSHFVSSGFIGSHNGKLVVYNMYFRPSRLWFYNMKKEELTWSILRGRSDCRNHLLVVALRLPEP